MKIKKNASRNMTSGNIYKHLIIFSIPLLIGNLFQLLYNTVDSVVVGRFVSTEALAAIGSASMFINILIYFFMGFSVGAGVLIAQCFGAKDEKLIQESVETTITITLILCVTFTIIGYFCSAPILRLIQVPEEVFDEALSYLQIYFIGISGLLVYNIGGSVFRAVGNSMMPLYILILSSIVNIVLDLIFVLVLGAGVEGVAWATVIAQLLSAVLIIIILTKTKEVYRMDWRKLHINKEQLGTILSVGLPTGIQLVITGFANLIAQSFVNNLGASCMAGWSCFNKLLNFALLPMVALANGTATFVSQNIGAKQYERTKEGIFKSNLLNFGVSVVISVLMFIFAESCVGIYTTDGEVIKYGAVFVRWIILSMIFYAVSNNTSVAMLGLKDSKIPTALKLIFWVGVRVTILYTATAIFGNLPIIISLSFSVSWILGTLAIMVYYEKHSKKRLICPDQEKE